MKKITKIRIINSILLILPIILGISLIWTGDDENRYWQGRAIGGATGILAILLIGFLVGAIAVYRKTKSISKTKAILKDAILALLSTGSEKSAKKKKK